MANVYIGSTPITKAEIGTTDVTAIYLGSEKVWPIIPGSKYVDGFDTNTLPNYSYVGPASGAAVSAGAMIVSGGDDGSRFFQPNGFDFLTDDHVVRFNLVQAVNSRQDAIIVRSNGLYGSPGAGYMACNFASGDIWFQRVLTSNTFTDVAVNGTLTTTDLNAGSTMELSVVGNRYVVTSINAAGTRRITKIDWTDTGNTAHKGSGFRKSGFRLSRASFGNSSSCEMFEAYDTSVYPVATGLTKNASNGPDPVIGVWQRVEGMVAQDGYAQNTNPGSNVITMTGKGTVTLDAAVRAVSNTTRSHMIRIVRNGSEVISTSADQTGSTFLTMTLNVTGVSVNAGDYFEVQRMQTSGTPSPVTSGVNTFINSVPTAPGI